ncbi:2-oxoglutarate dehydrogenase E1 subunit family protein [Escherichia coli]
MEFSDLSGSNQSWIEQLYVYFLTDPDGVDANWAFDVPAVTWYRSQTGSTPFNNA